jgi:hypothetical protein
LCLKSMVWSVSSSILALRRLTSKFLTVLSSPSILF